MTMNGTFFNRELSWLDFNLRVLEEAQDESSPLLERLKFLAITASNLDEFFMVRVGGLMTAARAGSTSVDPAGLSVSDQLERISVAVSQMTAAQYACYLEQIEPQLLDAGIRRVEPQALNDAQAGMVENVFTGQIQSVLTPMAIHPDTEFPLLRGGTLNVCVRLTPENEGEPDRFAIIPFGRWTRRFITLPSDGGYGYILAEDVVSHFAQSFFPGEEVLSVTLFRIVRNADLSLNEDEAPDFISGMEAVLDARQLSFSVRLDLSHDPCPEIRKFLQVATGVPDNFTFVCDGPLDVAGLARLADLPGFESLRFEDWSASRSPAIESGRSMFSQIAERDVLLHHPYESFEAVVRFVEEAAADSDVVAIKQTLYRTSATSRIVGALIAASESGKQVTALVEVKARFDEQRNIDWARRLERSGVQVIYGVKGLKTHAKVCLVVRQEPQGYQRYVHFGTGNYNEITARFYTDVSYFTANEAWGADAATCFNAVCGYSQPQALRRIEIAPLGLRSRLIDMINVERDRREQGHQARIIAKLNSLVDSDIIEALYSASQAGVEVQLNVRGICCLKPGVPGLSENISVNSIVDRYLEHSRIMYFHHGGDQRVFISSADWMPRNLDRRVELLVPVEDPECRRRLIEILEICVSDTVKSRRLQSDGRWTRVSVSEGGGTDVRAQSEFHRMAREAASAADQARLTMLEPHQSPEHP